MTDDRVTGGTGEPSRMPPVNPLMTERRKVEEALRLLCLELSDWALERMRDGLGHTNIAVLRLRRDNALESLATPRPAPAATEAHGLGWAREIVALAGGWDDEGVTHPRRPLRWDTVALMAIDYAKAALNGVSAPPAPAPAATPGVVSEEGLRAEVERLRALLNTPEIANFVMAVEREAAHQRDRWGPAHDDVKSDADWFWLVGYLAGKALWNPDGDHDKRLHRIITIAAACANWHRAALTDAPGAK